MFKFFKWCLVCSTSVVVSYSQHLRLSTCLLEGGTLVCTPLSMALRDSSQQLGRDVCSVHCCQAVGRM